MTESKKRATETTRIREHIRVEATRLIAQHGFRGISINDVAQAVGISKQALLYHFPTKVALRDAVLAYLLDYGTRQLPQVVATLISSDPNRLEQALDEIQTLFENEPYTAPVLLRELLDQDPTGMEQIRRGAEPWFRLVVDLIRHGQTHGRIRRDLDPEAIVVQIGTLVIATFALLPIHAWIDAEASVWRRRRLRETVRTIERMLFVSEFELLSASPSEAPHAPTSTVPPAPSAAPPPPAAVEPAAAAPRKARDARR